MVVVKGGGEMRERGREGRGGEGCYVVVWG
jgi:hypothetical protein